jgi:hypothetical protein
VITDGNDWEIHDLREMGGKQLVSLRISDVNSGETARKLLALWYPAMPSVAAGKASVIKPALQPEETDTPRGISLAQLGKRVQLGDHPPRKVLFPDGYEKELKHWKDLLIAVAEWTLPQLQNRLPIKAGIKRCLLNVRPLHSTGNPFKSPKQIGRFWLEAHYSAKGCVRQSLRLLDIVGSELKDQVRIEP